MTVGKKLKTTLSSLKSAQADFESFALETENQTVKDSFSQFANQTKSIVEGLKTRIQEIEEEEPQYKGK
ncbi:MAG: DUF1657 domain-containing protein [Bacillota bacterium]|nr:DUF1657 domain-containing protein [Bacillota bacterium]